jgi:hypothetical protein
VDALCQTVDGGEGVCRYTSLLKSSKVERSPQRALSGPASQDGAGPSLILVGLPRLRGTARNNPADLCCGSTPGIKLLEDVTLQRRVDSVKMPPRVRSTRRAGKAMTVASLFIDPSFAGAVFYAAEAGQRPRPRLRRGVTPILLRPVRPCSRPQPETRCT